jgi:hypothetical protein
MAIYLNNRTQKSKSLILALAAAGWSVTLPSLAQSPPESAPPDKIAPPLEENNRRPPADAGVDKIKPQDGVIKPPTNVDPDIQIKPPATGSTMPIIPPPGSPGGDPNIKPK